MRKPMRVILLVGLLLALMAVSVFAVGETGIKSITQGAGTTLKPVTAAGAAITPTGGTLYEGAAKVEMTYSSAVSGKFYLVYLLKGDTTVPTESNIAYIDQVTANGTSVSFTLYPENLQNGDYTVYLASNDGSGLKPVGSFVYEQAYMRGDVDGDGEITVLDALSALQVYVGTYQPTPTDTQKLAADADQDGEITVLDALLILQVYVGTASFD